MKIEITVAEFCAILREHGLKPGKLAKTMVSARVKDLPDMDGSGPPVQPDVPSAPIPKTRCDREVRHSDLVLGRCSLVPGHKEPCTVLR